MTELLQRITLTEWSTKDPSNCDDLRDQFLDRSVSTEAVLSAVSEAKLLEIVELRSGLRIKAFSHIGRIQIGDFKSRFFPRFAVRLF